MSRVQISKEMVKEAVLIRSFFTDRNYDPSTTFVSFLLHGKPTPNPEKIISNPLGFAGLVDNFHRSFKKDLEEEKKEISELIKHDELKIDELENVYKYLEEVSVSLRKIVTIFYKEEKGTTAVERDIKRELNILTNSEEKISKVSPNLYNSIKPVFGNVIIALRSPNKSQVMTVCGNSSRYFTDLSSRINSYLHNLKSNVKLENREFSIVNKTERVENKLVTRLYKVVGVIPKTGKVDNDRLVTVLEENFKEIVNSLDTFIKHNYVVAKLVEEEVEDQLRIA